MNSRSGSGGAPAACEKASKLGPQVAVDAVVLGPELGPAGGVGGRVAREDRRDRRVAHLERIARDDPHPRPAARRQRGEARHVVLADHVGPKLGDDLLEARVDVAGAVDQRLPGRLDEAAQLLDRRRAKHRRGVADEVLPELAGRLLDLGLGPEPHQPLLESARLERAREGLLDDEHDPVPAGAQHIADADAVVGGAERPLREEHDRRHAASMTAAGGPAPAHPLVIGTTRLRGPTGRRCSALPRRTSRSR